MEVENMLNTSKKIKNKNKRRFNDEQIKFLETMFETKSRPELQMKQHLATRLGLQPRQVAIWFQNRRARSKSKQIEQDYTSLKIKYDNLSSKFESLKIENQALLTQKQSLQQECEKKNCIQIKEGGFDQSMMSFYSDNNNEEDIMNVKGMGHLINEGASSSDENISHFALSEFLEPSRFKFQFWDYDFDNQNDLL